MSFWYASTLPHVQTTLADLTFTVLSIRTRTLQPASGGATALGIGLLGRVTNPFGSSGLLMVASSNCSLGMLTLHHCSEENSWLTSTPESFPLFWDTGNSAFLLFYNSAFLLSFFLLFLLNSASLIFWDSASSSFGTTILTTYSYPDYRLPNIHYSEHRY